MNAVPLPLLFLMFGAAAAMVWSAGTRLPRYAAAIAERTGIGQAFSGMLVLGGITSLPELATTTSAAAIGASALALNNILGSVIFNLVLLAVADSVLRRSSLTSVVAKPATLMQGILGIVLLALVAAAVAAGDRPLLGVGVWSILLFCTCLAAIWTAFSYERRPTWVAVGAIEEVIGEAARERESPPGGLVWGTVGLAALILSAGTVLALTGDELAERTGLGGGLVGLVLVAIATSLPELSAIRGAMSLKRYELAIGEVFGSNMFNLTLVFVIDLASPSGPVLDAAGSFEIVAALLGLVLTGIFVIGLLERRDRTILRMGYDSFAVLLLYAAGIVLLSQLAM